MYSYMMVFLLVLDQLYYILVQTRSFLLGFLLIMQFRIILNFGPNYLHNQLVKPDLLHILWLLLTSSIIIHASPLDSITYDPGYTLKISKTWKSEFLTPHFLRTEDHVRSYYVDSDSPWRVVLHKFFLLGLPWLEYLFGAKNKNTIFDPI